MPAEATRGMILLTQLRHGTVYTVHGPGWAVFGLRPDTTGQPGIACTVPDRARHGCGGRRGREGQSVGHLNIKKKLFIISF